NVLVGSATDLHTRIRGSRSEEGRVGKGKETYTDQVDDTNYDSELVAAGDTTDQTGVKVSSYKGAFNTSQTLLSEAWQLTNVLVGSATDLHTRIRGSKVVNGKVISGKETYTEQVDDTTYDSELVAAGDTTDQTGVKVSSYKGSFNTSQTLLSEAWQLTNVLVG